MEKQREQNMLFQVENCGDGVRLLRCFAPYEAEQIVIPKAILGLPVREIGAYAFSHVEGEREFHDGEEVWKAVGGNDLRDVMFPDTLCHIGRLAFYNCENLSRITFYDTVRDIEDGAFKNCERLSEVNLHVLRGKINCMKQVVVDVEQKVEARIAYVLEGQKAKLIFPEFGYGFEENCPGRIFHEYTYGSGNSYRQCFYNGEVRYQRYDELFDMAVREDPKETVLEIAVARLEYPYHLTEKDRAKYEAYLREKKQDAGAIAVKEDDLHTLELFFDWGILQREDLDWLIDAAARGQKIACLAWMMDRKLECGGKKKKVFEFS
ncbi:MAG: leucine-rich repeat domain-containing protein [Lachnospiraceae bacterium]|nr:leucine-rich repeat domain-containing protein [Robinsoniella sp.]MDY3765259.1 leucine-rich repeat domain-containing protein [Lachnospiraceae bacterium]